MQNSSDKSDFKHTGFVYVLRTPCLPQWVKIGYSIDVERRIKQLNTAVPEPFYPVGIWAVNGHKAAEKIIHVALKGVRSPTGTEHFMLSTQLDQVEHMDEYGWHYQEPLDNKSELRDYIERLLDKSSMEYEYAHGYCGCM